MWIVSQGRAFYDSVWDDPTRIPEEIDPEESFSGVAESVYWDRFEEPIPD